MAYVLPEYQPDNVEEFLNHISILTETLVGNLVKVCNAKEFGLDERAGYTFYVDKESRYIIIHRHDDRSLQYYGGFEYVEDGYRSVIGQYVFYSAENDRVNNAFEYWLGYSHQV